MHRLFADKGAPPRGAPFVLLRQLLFLALLCQQAAAMVIDAAEIRDRLDILPERVHEHPPAHVQTQFSRYRRAVAAGLHGQMEHDLLVTGMRLPGQSRGIVTVWQKGAGNRAGQGDDRIARQALAAEIIDDQGNAVSGRARG